MTCPRRVGCEPSLSVPVSVGSNFQSGRDPLWCAVRPASYRPLRDAPMREQTPVTVTAAELFEHWMSSDAVGMTDDHQVRMRIVAMRDGTRYQAPFEDVSAH